MYVLQANARLGEEIGKVAWIPFRYQDWQRAKRGFG